MPEATESASVTLKLFPRPLRPNSANLGILAAFKGDLFKSLVQKHSFLHKPRLQKAHLKNYLFGHNY